MDDAPKVVGNKLFLVGFIYYKVSIKKGRWYWQCKKYKDKICSATAITIPDGDQLIIIKGPLQSPHINHAPNREAAEAEIVKVNESFIIFEKGYIIFEKGWCVTRAYLTGSAQKKSRRPEITPAQILRIELPKIPRAVSCQLPERENLKQELRRTRRKDLPRNPINLNDLEDIPDRYKVTTSGDRFLLNDSRDGDEIQEGRVIVFATRKNLELLAASEVWFLDGTFKVCPNIFTQLFTILGTISKGGRLPGEEVQRMPIPLVYALLSSKLTSHYEFVLRSVWDSFWIDFGIQHCRPQKIMTDFEVAILNACTTVFGGVSLSTCFFHLGQSVYRHIQSEGLEALYNDPENRNIKLGTHMMLVLSFVPIDDVPDVFELLTDEVDEVLLPIIDYFEKTYVTGIRARGRRTALPPRYPVPLWNQYYATLTGAQRTNNCSECWHNRFNLVVGKNHPDLYTFLNEIKKEQADYETMVTELSLGRKVKAGPTLKWKQTTNRIMSIVSEYDIYKLEDTVLQYLEILANTIVLD